MSEVTRCPGCGAMLPKNMEYCMGCGQKIGGDMKTWIEDVFGDIFRDSNRDRNRDRDRDEEKGK